MSEKAEALELAEQAVAAQCGQYARSYPVALALVLREAYIVYGGGNCIFRQKRTWRLARRNFKDIHNPNDKER